MRVRVALAGLLVLAGLSARGPARAETNQECTNNDDITIVVDFQELGGGVNVRCAPQPVHNGFDTLQQAHIDYTPYGYFVCRIANQPEDLPCNRTPPGTYYWTYWIAARGGPWCYAEVGANDHHAPPGSVEGWSFFKYSSERKKSTPPRYPVPAAIAGTTPNQLDPDDCLSAPPKQVTTTTEVSTAPTAPQTGGPDPAAPTTTTQLRSATQSTVTTASAGESTTTSIVGAESYAVNEPPPSTIPYGDVDLAAPKTKSGVPWGFIGGAGIIVGLGAAAFVLRRRNFFG